MLLELALEPLPYLILFNPLSRVSRDGGEDGDLKLMRESDVPNVPSEDVGQGSLSAIDFLESIFPQIQRSELLQLLQSYKENVTDVVNHLIIDESMDDTDEIDTLVKLFPSSSSSQIQNAWIESNGKIHVAAQYLCEEVSDCKMIDLSGEIDDTIQEEDDSNHIYVLIEMFPDHSVEFLSSILQDHGLDKGISLLLKLDQACKGDCIDTGFPCLLHSSENCNSSFYSSSSVQVSQSKLGKNKSNFQFILPPISRSIEAPSHILLDENEISKGSVYLRNMAQNARQSRNEAYQKASINWKSNDLTRKGSASYYGVQVCYNLLIF
jgi:hypothetical protein